MQKLRSVTKRNDYFGETLFSASDYFLEQKNSAQTDYHCRISHMSAYVFLSFAVESYINHALFKVLGSGWTDKEKDTPDNKYGVLREKINAHGGISKLKKWSRVCDAIFKIRNSLAHQKPECDLVAEKEHNRGDEIDYSDKSLSPSYERMIFSRNIETDFDQIKEFVEHIKTVCDEKGYDLDGFNWPSGYSTVTMPIIE